MEVTSLNLFDEAVHEGVPIAGAAYDVGQPQHVVVLLLVRRINPCPAGVLIADRGTAARLVSG